MVELRKAATSIDEETEGRVKVKYYSGGAMGEDFAVKRKMRARQLQGAVLQTSVFNSEVPNLNVYNLPMQFKTIDEVAAVRSQLDGVLRQELEDAGYVSFGFVGIGLAYAMGTKRAITVEESRKLKVWVPPNDPSTELMLKAFGVNPVPLTIVDVLTGLQTGLIDTIASPPVAAIMLQWHTEVDYLLDVPFLYAYSVFVLDARAFRDISESDQETIRKHMDQAIIHSEKKANEDHESALDAILAEGMELVEPDGEVLKFWQTSADNAISDWIDRGLITQSIYDRFADLLKQYRLENAD